MPLCRRASPLKGRGFFDANLGRPRQSRRGICDEPPQCRLHGRSMPSPKSTGSAPAKKLPGLDRRTGASDAAMLLLKPATFMNESGRSVARRCDFYKLETPDVTVFHDELDLAPMQGEGQTRRRHGGHNGIRSIDPAYRRGFPPRPHRHRPSRPQGPRHRPCAGQLSQERDGTADRPARARSPPKRHGWPTAMTCAFMSDLALRLQG